MREVVKNYSIESIQVCKTEQECLFCAYQCYLFLGSFMQVQVYLAVGALVLLAYVIGLQIKILRLTS